MNNDRRKAIKKIVDSLELARSNAETALADITANAEEDKETLDGLQAEEREYYDNMPESFQNGDKGTAADQAATTLEEAVDGLGELVDALNEVDEKFGAVLEKLAEIE